jgi:hypothetical protein
MGKTSLQFVNDTWPVTIRDNRTLPVAQSWPSRQGTALHAMVMMVKYSWHE